MAGALGEGAASVSLEAGVHPGVDPRREAIDRWRAALERRDDDEVDRLVRQSRADRAEAARIGQLGAMLARVDPLGTIGAVE